MNRIKMLRKERGLSQLELAKVLNVHQTAVSQWEMQRTAPDMSLVVLLADYFSVSVDYILERTDVKLLESATAADAISIVKLKYTDEQLLEKIRKLDPAKRAAIENLVELLSN